MRISLKKILVTAALGFVVGCAPGTAGDGDGGDAECTSNLDCEGTQQCFLALGICEEPCTSDDECSGDRPVCNMRPDADSEYPLDADGTRDHCICTADSCAAGEVCSDVTGACEPGEETDAGPQDECTVATEVEDCGADAFCIDGTCEDACLDDDCIATGELCQYSDADPEFNQCVVADEVTATCADAAEAPAQEGPPHIVVYAHEAGDVTANACGTDGDLSLRTFFFDVYSETALEVADIYRANFAAGNDRFFGHPTDTAVDPIDGFDNEYLVTAYVCGNPDEVALYIDTAGDGVSNAYCFDATP